MLIYENTHYQVHALPNDGCDKQFQVVGKAFGLVEYKTGTLTNALFQSDAYSASLDKFFKEATGNFNPDLMKGPDTPEGTEEDTPEVE